MKSYRRICATKVSSVWADTISPPASIMAPGDRSGRSGWIFEILGEAGDMYKSINMLNYCDGQNLPLPCCKNKIRSTWTKVWTGPCRSTGQIIEIVADSGRAFDI